MPDKTPQMNADANASTQPNETTSTYKVEVIADSSGQWAGNNLTFDTPEKAETYAKDLFFRWTAVRNWRVVECGTGKTITQKR